MTNKYYKVLVFLLTLSLIYLFNISQSIRSIGFLSIILLIVLLFIHLFKNTWTIDNVFWFCLLLILFNFVILFSNFSSKALYLVIEEDALLLFFMFFSQIRFDKKTIDKIISFFSKIYYFLLIVIVILYTFNFEYIISMTISKAVFAISFFANYKSKNKLLFSLLSFFLFLYIGERTCAILFIIIYALFFLSKGNSKLSKYKLLFIIIAIFVASWARIYVWLQYQPISEKLNSISYEISGERFFSGRNRIWNVIIDNLEGKELFGLSYSNSLLADNSISISTHNLYLWLQMNGGYCLLLLFIVFLYQIWKKTFLSKSNNFLALYHSYFISFMILTSFELIWLSNNFVVSCYMWFVISMGIIYISNDNINENEVQKHLIQ